MSTLKVSNINHASASSGGLAIDSSGVVSGALPSPHRNLLYNGAMQVAQRGTSATGIITAGYYTLDRFRTIFDVAPGVWTQSQDTNAPDGFGSSLRMTCTTADASLTGSEGMVVEQYLEGQDVQHLLWGTSSAKSLTLSFWVKSNVTGTYVMNFRERDNNYLIADTYSVNVADTWEYKTITIPGLTLGSGMDNDNQLSFSIHFWLVAGPTYASGTLQTSWGGYSNPDRAPGQVNLAAAVDNYWQITGVQLEVGDTATDFEHKPYGVELAECQRYYWKPSAFSGQWKVPAWNWVPEQQNAVIAFPTTMRTGPSILASSGTNHHTFYIAGGFTQHTSVTAGNSTADSCDIYASTSGKTAGQAGWYSPSSGGSIAFSAEL